MTTNREWINTLSDEEWVEKADIKADTMCFSGIRCRENDEGKSVDKCRECTLDWLKAPHETTADEDFAEIGFDKEEESDTAVRYSDAFGRSFDIWETDIRFKTCSESIKLWNNWSIDQIRTIAEKKRKEMGWK